MSDILIDIQGVKKRYIQGDEELWALKGIDLQIYRGEFISIMGPSGSGKSTLFNQIGALDVPTEGKVLFEGQNIFSMIEPCQAWFRNHKIGYIFQTFNLIPVMSALQNVALPAVFAGLARSEAEARAKKVLERVGLGHRIDHKPSELSGGQQQRVAIARALVNSPDVVLADEPTGNLDTATGMEVIQILKTMNEEEGVTVVCSTHDPKMLRNSERVVWMEDGRKTRESTAEDFNIDDMDADTLGRS
jgi:putative ABC transport system ATP-binding protein